jgi:hypothetical protein
MVTRTTQCCLYLWKEGKIRSSEQAMESFCPISERGRWDGSLLTFTFLWRHDTGFAGVVTAALCSQRGCLLSPLLWHQWVWRRSNTPSPLSDWKDSEHKYLSGSCLQNPAVETHAPATCNTTSYPIFKTGLELALGFYNKKFCNISSQVVESHNILARQG